MHIRKETSQFVDERCRKTYVSSFIANILNCISNFLVRRRIWDYTFTC